MALFNQAAAAANSSSNSVPVDPHAAHNSNNNNSFSLTTTANLTEFALGAVSGAAVGFSTKAFGRLALLSVFTSAVSLNYLVSKGFVNVNWQKVNSNTQQLRQYLQLFAKQQIAQHQQEIDALRATAAAAAAKDENWFIAASSSAMELLVGLMSAQLLTFAGAGFAIGAVVGLRQG